MLSSGNYDNGVVFVAKIRLWLEAWYFFIRSCDDAKESS